MLNRDLERLRSDVAKLQRRLADQEHQLEEAEGALRREEHKAAVARRGRATVEDLSAIEKLAYSRVPDGIALCVAVGELRDLVLSSYDRWLLQGVRERMTGEERDLIERLLEMTDERGLCLKSASCLNSPQRCLKRSRE